jgi:MFS family permease
MGLAVLVIANDFTASAVALPAMQAAFDADITTVQWVINGYTLVFGVLIVTGGPARRHVRPPPDLLSSAARSLRCSR